MEGVPKKKNVETAANSTDPWIENDWYVKKIKIFKQ